MVNSYIVSAIRGVPKKTLYQEMHIPILKEMYTSLAVITRSRIKKILKLIDLSNRPFFREGGYAQHFTCPMIFALCKVFLSVRITKNVTHFYFKIFWARIIAKRTI